jgi:Domain of unknown function (DUF4388)
MSHKGLSGNLGTMTLPDVLQWASRGQKSGTLALKSGSVTKKIYLKAGVIVGSSSNDPRDYLGQVLLSEGLITERQLKEAMDLQSRTRVMLGRILVQWKAVTEERVAAVLRHKAEETIYSLFLWTDAEFEFFDDELPPGEQVLISVQVEEVLLEGVRRYDTAQRIRELLPNNDLTLSRTGRPLAADIAAKPFAKKLYDLVDGRRSIADIILEAHSAEFNVCQVLYVFVQRGNAALAAPPAAGSMEAIAGSATPASQPAPAATAIEPVLKAARGHLDRGDAEAALIVLDSIRDEEVRSPELAALCVIAEQFFVERAYRHYLPPGKIPILKRPLESLLGDNLSPAEGFLVSRVNGSWDVRSIMSISPLREVDALRALKKLRERGIIDLVDAPPQARTA